MCVRHQLGSGCTGLDYEASDSAIFGQVFTQASLVHEVVTAANPSRPRSCPSDRSRSNVPRIGRMTMTLAFRALMTLASRALAPGFKEQAIYYDPAPEPFR